MLNLSSGVSDFGIQDGEMDAYMESLKSGHGNPARQVCICGHLLKRHVNNQNASYCRSARAYCGCQSPLPVLEPEDLRPFVFNSEGVGKKHALAKGIHALHRSGKSARWLVELVCFKCYSEVSSVLPVAFSRDFRITDGVGYSNALLCQGCIDTFDRHYKVY